MGVTGRRVRLLGGVAGILFVVIAIVAFFLPGAPPKATEAAKVTSYIVSKRGSLLAGDFLVGIAFTFFLVFVGSLRVHFGATEHDGIRPGSVMLAGGVVGAALVLVGTAVTNGAAFRVAALGDTNLNLALYDTASDLFFIAGFGFAAFFIGAALAGSATRSLPAMLVPTAWVVALLQIVSGIGLFAKSGFFAIGGAFGFIALLTPLIWVLAASVALLRPGATAAPAPAGS